ncbi:MAG: hypothetical protein LBS71_02035, partial [Puniceicoccales bacterium]|nr:hypothetical protein [Puniceicoccales bacterium]
MKMYRLKLNKFCLSAYFTAMSLLNTFVLDASQKLTVDGKSYRDRRSKVYVQKYFEANPDFLGDIPDDATVTQNEKLGEGGLGVVYAATANGKDIVAKRVKEQATLKGTSNAKEVLFAEARIGEDLRNARAGITESTLLSDVQGLELISIPRMLKSEELIQKRIPGMDGYCSIFGKQKEENGKEVFVEDPISLYANGYVTNPKQALELACQVSLALHCMHEKEIVHHDVKLDNLMIEPVEDPFKNVYYRAWLIDVGLAVKIGE